MTVHFKTKINSLMKFFLCDSSDSFCIDRLYPVSCQLRYYCSYSHFIFCTLSIFNVNLWSIILFLIFVIFLFQKKSIIYKFIPTLNLSSSILCYTITLTLTLTLTLIYYQVYTYDRLKTQKNYENWKLKMPGDLPKHD